jgi:hypothetical protein
MGVDVSLAKRLAEHCAKVFVTDTAAVDADASRPNTAIRIRLGERLSASDQLLQRHLGVGQRSGINRLA